MIKILNIIAFIIAGYFIINSPNDYQQGELIKLLYLHVPAAWLSIQIYLALAISYFCYIITNKEVFALFAKALLPIGFCFTIITLICGSFWGAKSWGSFWIWDARLISELILAFIYLAIILLHNNFDNVEKADFACAILAIIGAINIPIIKFSVKWWNSLHQDSSVNLIKGSDISPIMLKTLLICYFTLALYSLSLFLWRYKIEKNIRAFLYEENKNTRLAFLRNLNDR